MKQGLKCAVLMAAWTAAGAMAQDSTYKIAYIDPLSGPFANVGQLMLSRVSSPDRRGASVP